MPDEPTEPPPEEVFLPVREGPGLPPWIMPPTEYAEVEPPVWGGPGPPPEGWPGTIETELGGAVAIGRGGDLEGGVPLGRGGLGGGIEPMYGDWSTMNQEMKAISILGGNIMDGRSCVGSKGTGAP